MKIIKNKTQSTHNKTIISDEKKTYTCIIVKLKAKDHAQETLQMIKLK